MTVDIVAPLLFLAYFVGLVLFLIFDTGLRDHLAKLLRFETLATVYFWKNSPGFRYFTLGMIILIVVVAGSLDMGE